MHSLETGIIVSIAAFFFLSFLTFTLLREVNVSKELSKKCEEEKYEYQLTSKKNYNPEFISNILDIITEGDKKNGQE